ncbi:amidase [Rubellimicrobium aerolatum]|uniref:Amidase n=1 Tax=Rubellimicrobium aerolatum TaxID=490979 RepID=A0ABW0SCJ0_9RHOB|nr:amidase [Rubellimicrobium aerolatum]MBP1806284.1 Asp-tRNA(Asn)/Glu-tRNA(Gln) amidotransferase A subunit family amidase [Rubellimicrobium aerolatum]
MSGAHRLTASAARAEMRAGRLTALELVRDCLGRIAERDGTVRAWVAINPRAEAEAALIRADDPRPLAGLPVGVKDVIDTADLPTTHNSPLYGGHRPAEDAPVVQMLRAAGAIVLGKTDTTEFAAAGRDAVTANPRDPARSPGGSSAGSAAAVADFHVPLALGTQTGGSTIRPASFCGIVGMKPSFGMIPTEGVKRYAGSFDTVGLHARAAEDLDLLAGVFMLPGDRAVPQRPRLALWPTPYADRLSPEMRRALAALPDRLGPVAEVVAAPMPDEFAELDALHRRILWAEGGVAFRNLAMGRRHRLHADFHARVAESGRTARQAFEAQDRLAALRGEFERRIAPFDALVAPAAPGFAPLGRGPGDPVFNALFTAMQVPCLALPLGGFDLPLGVQLVGRRAADADLIALARHLGPALAARTEPRETTHV